MRRHLDRRRQAGETVPHPLERRPRSAAAWLERVSWWHVLGLFRPGHAALGSLPGWPRVVGVGPGRRGAVVEAIPRLGRSGLWLAPPGPAIAALT